MTCGSKPVFLAKNDFTQFTQVFNTSYIEILYISFCYKQVMARLPAGGPEERGSIPCIVSDFSPLRSLPTGSGAHINLRPAGTECYFADIKGEELLS